MKEAEELRKHAQAYREDGYPEAAENCERIAAEIERVVMMRGRRDELIVNVLFIGGACAIAFLLVAIVSHLFLTRVQ
jgi:hypothetical protein